LSGLGEQREALGVGAEGTLAPVAVTRDAELTEAGLTRPFCARVAGLDGATDRATALLSRALTACTSQLDHVLPEWTTRRVGLVLGTSSGGMRTFEHADTPNAYAATYLGPVLDVPLPCDVSPFALVLGACASGTLAIGLAREWLRADRCDIALCGGFDAVSVFVASGFEVLRATCTSGSPRPFRVGRDGLALGEGAAVLAMVRRESLRGGRAFGYVTGFGATCDAVHLTAPDRAGAGLMRAARHAMEDAGATGIDLVSAHGTATDFNDAAEACALHALLGDAAKSVPLHALKGGTGHTLGASGALETLAALAAMQDGVAPASAGTGAVDGGVNLFDRVVRRGAKNALKLSAAFGGSNAALVLARDVEARPPAARARTVYVSRAASVTSDVASAIDARTLAGKTGYPEERILRADGLVRLTLAAVAKLREALPVSLIKEGAGIVVGHGLATVDTNAMYLARIRAVGAHRGEPRRFPYTTPNAAAGECAVAFGLKGPSFAVGCGPHGGLEALSTAADLVRGGVAEQMLVVAVDEAGEASRTFAPGTQPGAVALLVAATPLSARLDACDVGLRARRTHTRETGPIEAHRALLPLVDSRPDSLSLEMPFGGFANARFFWL
jgi:3-oxoacyl-[acyl-carrier-protein] synthase-1/3-oxoacyl-[acyl-carrier-protein] synthase II